MFLFNVKLFFKITIAILSGTTVSDTLSADTVVKATPAQPTTETIQTEIKKENTLVDYKWDKVSVNSLDSTLITPKKMIDNNKVKSEV